MATKISSISSLKIGSYLMIDNFACKVVNIQVSRPGKHGHAKSRIEAIGILDGKKRIIVKPSHDSVDIPIIEKRNAQVLSINGDSASVMDSETYETFELAIPEELKQDLVIGNKVLYWDVVGTRVMKQIRPTE